MIENKRVLDFLVKQHLLHLAHSKLNDGNQKNLNQEGKKIKADESYRESLLLELNRFIFSYEECDDMCIGITPNGKFFINQEKETSEVCLKKKGDWYPVKTSIAALSMTKNANNIAHVLQKYIEKKEICTLHYSGFNDAYSVELLKEYGKEETTNDTTSET